MTQVRTRDDLAQLHAGTTRWDRLLAALDNAPALRPGVAHSVGDSLTYWRSTSAALAGDDFVGHRRYQTVLAVLDGELHVELAPRRSLHLTDPYSDLSDRERGRPTGPAPASHRVLPGQVLAVPPEDAWRVAPVPHADVLVVRLTVEGATFHNK